MRSVRASLFVILLFAASAGGAFAGSGLTADSVERPPAHRQRDHLTAVALGALGVWLVIRTAGLRLLARRIGSGDADGQRPE